MIEPSGEDWHTKLARKTAPFIDLVHRTFLALSVQVVRIEASPHF
jgi:hypothetical protein